MSGFLLSTSGLSQDAYEFVQFNRPYQYLDDNTSVILTENDVWVYDEYYIPIGFNFNINGCVVDSVYLNTNGEFYFFQCCDPDNLFFSPGLLAFFSAMLDKGNFIGNLDVPYSPISYMVEGPAGDKILKIEWRNASLMGGNGSQDSINFQVWFYESSGIIEIHSGPNHLTNPYDTGIWLLEPGPMVALDYVDMCDENDIPVSILLYGNENNPTDTNIVGFINNIPQYYLNSIPQEGVVFQFKPIDTNIETGQSLDLILFPNPFDEKLFIEGALGRPVFFFMYDVMGNEIFHQKIDSYTSMIDVGNISSGVYFYRIISGNSMVSEGKLIKI